MCEHAWFQTDVRWFPSPFFPSPLEIFSECVDFPLPLSTIESMLPCLWVGPGRAGLCPREMTLEEEEAVVRTAQRFVSEGPGLKPLSATI